MNEALKKSDPCQQAVYMDGCNSEATHKQALLEVWASGTYSCIEFMTVHSVGLTKYCNCNCICWLYLSPLGKAGSPCDLPSCQDGIHHLQHTATIAEVVVKCRPSPTVLL